MNPCVIDHLVITAPDLATGAQYVENKLGVPMQQGGEHPRMGTHNLLLSLGPGCYLEVIACQPNLAPPASPRWFALDQITPTTPPALTTWVARTDNIQTAAAQATEDLGAIAAMTRGNLDWQITIPPDGSLPLGGAAPALIEWQKGDHPSEKLTDHGLSLQQLDIQHPGVDLVKRLLHALALKGPVVVTPGNEVKLTAHIKTPAGIRSLTGY